MLINILIVMHINYSISCGNVIINLYLHCLLRLNINWLSLLNFVKHSWNNFMVQNLKIIDTYNQYIIT